MSNPVNRIKTPKSFDDFFRKYKNLDDATNIINDLNTGGKKNPASAESAKILYGMIGAKQGILESGTNANGEYIKFDDGTLICSKSMFINLTPSSGARTDTWTFPAEFAGGLIKVFVSANFQSSADMPKFVHAGYVRSGSATLDSTRVIVNSYFSSACSYAYRPDIFAIGKWQ